MWQEERRARDPALAVGVGAHVECAHARARLHVAVARCDPGGCSSDSLRSCCRSRNRRTRPRARAVKRRSNARSVASRLPCLCVPLSGRTRGSRPCPRLSNPERGKAGFFWLCNVSRRRKARFLVVLPRHQSGALTTVAVQRTLLHRRRAHSSQATVRAGCVPFGAQSRAVLDRGRTTALSASLVTHQHTSGTIRLQANWQRAARRPAWCTHAVRAAAGARRAAEGPAPTRQRVSSRIKFPSLFKSDQRTAAPRTTL
jgi:hypothetical protein